MVKYNLTKVDWNNEYNWDMEILNELTTHYINHSNLHIELNEDGMDVAKSGLATVLKFLDANIIDCDIIIENANLLQNNTYTDVYKSGFKFAKVCQHTTSITKEIKTAFSMFSGRPTWDRLALGSWLFNNTNCIQTFQGSTGLYQNYENTGEVSNGVEFDTLCKRAITEVDIHDVLHFIKHIPLSINYTSGRNACNHPLLLTTEYNSVFVDVVSETAKVGNVFFPTEKTFRPIMFLTPFIVYGPIGYLKNLKKLGFKTFDQWFDESYDTVIDDNQRLVEVISLLLYINTKSMLELENINREMQDVLKHNVKVLMDLTETDFNRERFK